LRLFVAVWPPEDVLERLSDLPRAERPGLRWTTKDQWHVTLRFLGSVTEVDRVKAALTRLESQAGAMAAAGPVVQRLGRGILCLPVGGLEAIAQAVMAVTGDIGEPAEDRPFKGHLTLARAKPGVDIRPFAGAPFSAAWPVTEITLVASDTRPDGARYEIVARARLR
jgi:RNA 2',3'-cyclic 3'-phosphodiesterase